MKINTIYHSEIIDKEFGCIVHIKNRTIMKITSIHSRELNNELEELQPLINGSENYNLWKNKRNGGYPYYLIYNSRSGFKTLYLNYSKLGYLITMQRLKIKNSNIVTSFIVLSVLGLIGISMNIISGEFELSDLNIIIYIWCILAVLIMWYLRLTVERGEKEIIALKKENY